MLNVILNNAIIGPSQVHRSSPRPGGRSHSRINYNVFTGSGI